MKIKFVYVSQNGLQRDLFGSEPVFQKEQKLFSVGHYYAEAENALEKDSVLLGFVCGFDPEKVDLSFRIVTRSSAIKGVAICPDCIRLLHEKKYPVTEIKKFNIWRD